MLFGHAARAERTPEDLSTSSIFLPNLPTSSASGFRVEWLGHRVTWAFGGLVAGGQCMKVK